MQIKEPQNDLGRIAKGFYTGIIHCRRDHDHGRRGERIRPPRLEYFANLHSQSNHV